MYVYTYIYTYVYLYMQRTAPAVVDILLPGLLPMTDIVYFHSMAPSDAN